MRCTLTIIMLMLSCSCSRNGDTPPNSGGEPFRPFVDVHAVKARVWVFSYSPITDISHADGKTEAFAGSDGFRSAAIEDDATVTFADGRRVEVGRKVVIGDREFQGPETSSEAELHVTIGPDGTLYEGETPAWERGPITRDNN